MKRIILTLGMLLVGAYCYADYPNDGAVTFWTDSGQVIVSSVGTPVPTQILTHSPTILRTWIINTSTFSLIVSSFSKVLTSTGDITIPASTIFSPDGPVVPYWGPMFAVINGTSSTSTGNNITILRTR